ncbi:MAG TPA: group II intron maturase-specific domain-containing protein, partial [Chloroflexota bacterium]
HSAPGDLARDINVIVRSWTNYYGRFDSPRWRPASDASMTIWWAGPSGNTPKAARPQEQGV